MSKPYRSLVSVPERGVCKACGAESVLCERLKITWLDGTATEKKLCRQCRSEYLSAAEATRATALGGAGRAGGIPERVANTCHGAGALDESLADGEARTTGGFRSAAEAPRTCVPEKGHDGNGQSARSPRSALGSVSPGVGGGGGAA